MLKLGVICACREEESHPLCDAESFSRVSIPRSVVAEVDHRGVDETSGLNGRQS
jgi:hypothetical protein